MINYTPKVIRTLKEAGLFPDTMFTCAFVLECLYKNQWDVLDELDDNSSSKRMLLLYYDLLRRQLIKETPDGIYHYEITPMGASLVKILTGETEKTPAKDWFEVWMDLWPKGVSTGGKLVKSDAKSCEKKLKKFLKEYDYSIDIIINATRRYIQSFESTDYAFIKAAVYFIEKRGEGSELAAWCEKELNTETDQDQYATTISNGLI